MKRKIWLLFSTLFLALSLMLSGCTCPDFVTNIFTKSGTAEEAKKEQQAFEEYVTKEFVTSFEDNLIGLHFTLKDPTSYGIEKPENPLPPLTLEYNEECKEEMEKSKKALAAIDSSLLTEKQQIFYETISHYLDQQIALSDYTQFTNLLSADQGIASQLPITLSEYSFETEEDIKDYLLILTKIPDYLEEALEWEKVRDQDGYCMAEFEIDDAVNQIDRFLSEGEDNLLIDSFHDRMENAGFLSEDQKKTYEKNNEQLINHTVLPAFSALKEGLLSLTPSDENNKGLCHYENGKEYYELLIQSMTLSDRSISQMVKTLEKRMKVISKRVSKVYREDPKAYEILSDNNDFNDETPEEMLKRLSTCIQDEYPALTKDISYQVNPIPDALQNNVTAAYYMIPPVDAKTENKIYYNKNRTESASLFTTLAHEGYPGHMYQNQYFLSTDPYPLYSVIDFTGYKEGWAYYTEIDCTKYNDYGQYDENYHDSLTELSRCNDEFGYCLSSLIDLYVNWKGMSEEEIKDVLDVYGLDQTSAKSFYEYAIEEPGAYLQYYIGYLELLSIRNEAEKELKNQFSAKNFHREILETGPCYYSQLEKIIKNWADSVKK